MTNDKSDVKKLEPLMGIATELRSVEPNRETVMDVLTEIGADGTPVQRIVFGKRDLQPEPSTEPEVSRALARKHEFHSIDAFSDYVARESDALAALILADVEAERMVATLDENVESDREMVSFKATTHPLFAPWKALIGEAVPVLQFALFVMQQRSVVLDPDGRELALMFSQIKSSKTVTKKAGVGPKALNGVMVETQIGSELRSVEMELPEQIVIKAPLYLDTDPIEIKLDVLVTDTPNGIVVFLTAPLLEEAAFGAFKQFVDSVKKKTQLLVGFGKVQERNWLTVPQTKSLNR